jgi:hypothetical protein
VTPSDGRTTGGLESVWHEAAYNKVSLGSWAPICPYGSLVVSSSQLPAPPIGHLCHFSPIPHSSKYGPQEGQHQLLFSLRLFLFSGPHSRPRASFCLFLTCRFVGSVFIHEDGGNILVRNVGTLLPGYIQYSSESPPSEPQIEHGRPGFVPTVCAQPAGK